MAGGFAIEGSLALCKGMSGNNAPRRDANGRLINYRPVARVNNVAVLKNPAPRSCLSSAFGPRRGKLHKGIDLQSRPAGPVVAAAGGTIVEARTRADYGRYVLISHGQEVFTRYAHLASTTGVVKEGTRVAMGETLGVMGNSASYAIPIHLHYEVLVGDYSTPKRAFGLKPVNVLSY